MSATTVPPPQSAPNNLSIPADEQEIEEPQEWPAAPEDAEAEVVNPFRWFILIGLITAAILQVLDTTIVNVALPQMAGNLGATSEEIGWVVTGYILSNVIVLPMTAFLTLRFGRKRYLTASIVLFIVASFFCGTSHSLGKSSSGGYCRERAARPCCPPRRQRWYRCSQKASRALSSRFF